MRQRATFNVIPAKAGIQNPLNKLDSRFRGNDGLVRWAPTLILLLTACASDFPVRPDPAAADAAVPVVRDGFSVLPPGAGWTVSLPAETVAIFDPVDPTPEHTRSASVILLDLERNITSAAQLASLTRERREREVNPHRYLILRHTDVPDPATGPLCARHELAARDFSTRTADGMPRVLVSVGVTCMHPHTPNHAVEIGYVQMSNSERASPELEDTVRQLIHTLSYTPVIRISR